MQDIALQDVRYTITKYSRQKEKRLIQLFYKQVLKYFFRIMYRFKVQCKHCGRSKIIRDSLTIEDKLYRMRSATIQQQTLWNRYHNGRSKKISNQWFQFSFEKLQNEDFLMREIGIRRGVFTQLTLIFYINIFKIQKDFIVETAGPRMRYKVQRYKIS